VDILFLDIDGVLNDHEFDEDAKSSTISRECADRLNRILEATKAMIVLSSAWRYMVLKNAMTLTGFEYLLRTHWIVANGRLIGTTREDSSPNEPRRNQILEYVEKHKPERWVAIDDLDLDLPFHVKTNPEVGR